MAASLRYDHLNLGQKIDNILEQDFWVMEHLTPNMFSLLSEPVKLSSTVSIFIIKGSCKADINLIPYEIQAPAIVNIGAEQILKPTYMSPDFDASFVVLSKRMKDNIFLFVNDPFIFDISGSNPIMAIPAEEVEPLTRLYANLNSILHDTDNTNRYQTILFTLLAYIFNNGMRCYRNNRGNFPHNPGRLSERFLKLVRQHFKSERFLDFYAKQLEVTGKHLSRTVKAQTGYTAVEWIERFIVLEAQVLLKSSNLHVQQIADELNFPSQSVFGKYFKKQTGLSPREFRNSK